MNIETNQIYRKLFSWKYAMKHWPDVSQPLSLLFLCVIVWTLIRILLPEYTVIHAVPMRMAILFVGAQICGVLLRLMQLPEMLGMLGFGVFFTNMGWGDFTPYQSLESFFRYGQTPAYTDSIQRNLLFHFRSKFSKSDLALVNIMLLAGLGIELKAFIAQWSAVGRLTIIPTIGEVAVITLIAKWMFDFPWLWGILLG